MERMCRFLILLALIEVLSACPCKAQLPGASTSTAASLDVLLQDYAYRAFVHPRTGIPYDGQVPSNLTGIQIAAMRLRSGSLWSRGVRSYKEFQVPVGVIVQPYVERLVLVYQNLGNWSSFYYPLPGFTYLTPVLGLLAYNAANLSATNLPLLNFVASKSPLLVNFTDARPAPDGLIAKCVWFNIDGSSQFRELVAQNACSTYRQGHFAIVINSTGIAPSPAPSLGPPGPSPGHKSKVRKIVGGVVGGTVGLVLLVLLVGWMCRYMRNKKVAEMERRADVGEALRMARVGETQAPVASGTRTQPVLETEYAA